MNIDDNSAHTLNLEMPIYDGSVPVETLLPDQRSRLVYRKLLKEQIRRERHLLEEAKHWMAIELVLKARIIGEYMEQQGIENIRRGIKEFNAFQDQQLSLMLMRRTPLTGFCGIQ